jgi:choline kinase
LITRALLLAAGRGSRLAPLTDDRPKCLVPLLGRPLLEYQIAALRRAGITDIAIVGGYRHECLEPFVATRFLNPRWAQSNMVVSLACAAEWLAAGDSLVCYTDIVYAADAVGTLARNPGDIAITYDPNWLQLWSARFSEPLQDAESFAVDEAGRLIGIGRKNASLHDIHGQYMGLVKLTRAGWRTITDYLRTLTPETVDRLDVTALLARLLDNGVRVDTVPAPWPWVEVDNAADLALYEQDVRFAELRAMLDRQANDH